MKKLEEFWFRYFSYSTINSKYGWVRYLWYVILLIPLVIGVVLDLFHKNGHVPLFIFLGMFGSFAIVWMVVWFYHNWRIKHETGHYDLLFKKL
jgi:hypothetical protein